MYIKKKTWKTFAKVTIISLLIIGMICAGYFYYCLFYPQFHPKKKVYVYIDQNDNIDSIYNKVKEKGKAKCFTGFIWMSNYRNYASCIHTGRYAIHPGENVYHVFSRIYRGFQEPVNLTIANVRTVGKLARSVGRQLMIDSADIAKLMNDSSFELKLGYTKETIPCLFLPNTYEVYWDITVANFFKRMEQEHHKFWNKQRLAKASAIGMTPVEVCTLASIVEEETNNKQEKPMVAGLYINRLHTGMPLQADPTIKFALQDFSLRRISNEHLNTKSPYNTYLNTGLPPGPIRIASPVSIDAVLNYVKHNYIYMCAKEDFSGTHNFASNYNEHMKNARKYWKALNERKIFK